MAHIKGIDQQQGGKQGQHHQEANQVLGGPWSIAYGNGAIVLGHIPGHILKILDHLPGQDQQKEEEGVHKDPGLEIPIVHEQYKKGGNGQGGRDQVAHKGDPFELVGIEPDPKNIGRKEQHRPKGDITGHKDRQKIEDEIGGQLKALGHQTVQHALGRLVRSEEHTSELQSRENLVCRLLLEKKKQEKQIKHEKTCNHH